jgi:hypothetical protein
LPSSRRNPRTRPASRSIAAACPYIALQGYRIAMRLT